MKKTSRGGARPGAGRPAADNASGMRRVNVMLDDATVTAAKRIGGGNLSVGLRRAVKIATS